MVIGTAPFASRNRAALLPRRVHRGRDKDERVTREEIHAAMRSSGSALPSHVHAVILETGGSFSVISGVEVDEHVEPCAKRRVRAPRLTSSRDTDGEGDGRQGGQ